MSQKPENDKPEKREKDRESGTGHPIKPIEPKAGSGIGGWGSDAQQIKAGKDAFATDEPQDATSRFRKRGLKDAPDSLGALNVMEDMTDKQSWDDFKKGKKKAQIYNIKSVQSDYKKKYKANKHEAETDALFAGTSGKKGGKNKKKKKKKVLLQTEVYYQSRESEGAGGRGGGRGRGRGGYGNMRGGGYQGGRGFSDAARGGGGFGGRGRGGGGYGRGRGFFSRGRGTQNFDNYDNQNQQYQNQNQYAGGGNDGNTQANNAPQSQDAIAVQ
uniref:Hyaluronan/mRNA-binding protein domain-containing protein n=1 Tax=Elphidium margaritaceum TaxID=933848 RepID=A0A7S0TG18_9EUKA|mmetsp:Transcript_1195/g.2333  ORF Transcript_1195/g.2333 Transcript_1195/m.2333 type:complete len:271 (+) Transcript_1195:180-992(+)|eukprot:CAMPEP_0202689462 /NCGR_PEP_ID=MMETSP1385-20130828/4717_1 /ASSEMBLY_ACC=CAM_ASM_000861 /TAXON_ID=933848 /ORGANISM="Elphidium margaritaceum" /LENGTH=270 /DNA_ID=CAMNT_0049344597 /DNA_START=126 /DNA_END=938 /DNA_ORIENTATION=-